MSQFIGLDEDDMKEIIATEQDERAWHFSPSPWDIPTGATAEADANVALELRVRYFGEESRRSEEVMDTAPEGPLTLVRGQNRGKILWLRVPPGPDHLPVAPEALADRLNRIASGLDRDNQRLNFRTIANILQRFARELSAAG